MKKKQKITYVDLFCGAGGLSLGFDRAGFENIFSIDLEKSFCQTYTSNFPKHTLIQKDISTLTEKEIFNLVGNKEVDVIIGGPPCQGFSMAGNIGRTFTNDPRNHLFKEFVRIVSILRPKYFVMENVARLYTHNNGKTRQEITNAFKELGYKVDSQILCTKDYGVPQARNRVIFIGNRVGTKNLFPKKKKISENEISVYSAISDLPKLGAGEVSKIPNHIAMNHSEQMLQKMSYIPDGGDRSNIPENIRPKSGDIRKYIRYLSTEPSICITGDMRKVFHYSQNRALTVRELARIQSFPDNFIFKGTTISQQQQVGNAVPPLLAESIAHSIIEMNNYE